MQIDQVVEVNFKMRITRIEKYPDRNWVSGYVLGPDGTDMKGGSGAFVPVDAVVRVETCVD